MSVFKEVGSIGNRILLIRKQKKLTQENFAKSVGTTQDSLGKIERGINRPSNSLLIAISYVYAVRPEWLETGEGELFEENTQEVGNTEKTLAYADALEQEDSCVTESSRSYFQESEDWKREVIVLQKEQLSQLKQEVSRLERELERLTHTPSCNK